MLATPQNVKVGDIVYKTYHYDRVFHTFYRILEKKGKSTIAIQEVRKDWFGGQNHGSEKPTEELRGKSFSTRYGKKGFKIDRYCSALEVWDGTPLEYSDWN